MSLSTNRGVAARVAVAAILLTAALAPVVAASLQVNDAHPSEASAEPWNDPPSDEQALTSRPVSAPQPVWYTDAVHETAVEAGKQGMAYNWVLDEAVPVSPGLKPIRPGMPMVAPEFCTLGFVFGTPGAYQVSTAGHCFVDRDTEELLPNTEVVMLLPTRDGASASLLLAVGDYVDHDYSADGADWGLADVYAAQQDKVSPTVLGWGGPVGEWHAWDGIPQPVAHVGRPALSANGLCDTYLDDYCEPEEVRPVDELVWGVGAYPRMGVVVGTDHRTGYGHMWACVCEVEGGDSGSPVLVYPGGEEPEALGIVSKNKILPRTSGSDLASKRMATGTMIDAIPADLALGMAPRSLIPDGCSGALCDPPDLEQVCDELLGSSEAPGEPEPAPPSCQEMVGE